MIYNSERYFKALYGYVRVSTDTQEKKGYGLQEQKELIEKYCKKHGYILKGIYIDAGISGAKYDLHADAAEDALSQRQEFLKLVSVIEEGEAVVVRDTSRLWRSEGVEFHVKKELMKKHADILSIEFPEYSLYEANASNKFVNKIMEAKDTFERDTIVGKLAAGRSVKAETGQKPAGRLPFGYQYSYDRKTVEIVPEEEKILRIIYREAQKGTSLNNIAKLLNSMGSMTRRGKPWCKQTLHLMLRNDFYIGVVTHQGKKIPGKFPPMISKVQFGKIKSQLQKHHN